MGSPFVSVVMPVYNAEKYLSEAIDSILHQTYDNFELIIINDGSTDSSIDIIKSYRDDRIKVLENVENSGIVYSLNKGIDNSSGKYIARMDSDDISVPQRIEKQVDFMEKNPDIDISGGLIKAFGIDPQNSYLPPITSEEIKCTFVFDSAMNHPTVIMRADVINKYNLRYQDYVIEDYLFWISALDYCNFKNIPEVLLNYRITKSSLTSALGKKEQLRKENFLQAYDIMLKKCKLNSSIEDRTLQYYFNSGKLDYSDVKKLKKHLKRIIRANMDSNYYDNKVLKNMIGKRWIAYIKRNRQYKNVASVFTLYGTRYILARFMNNPIKVNSRE